MSADFHASKMYTYIKGYAMAMGWTNVLNALAFARDKHEGQTRKDGQPYIVHPLTMASHALALDIKNEAIVAAAILHDVCEDCGVGYSELPVDQAIRDAVRWLTHIKPEPLEPYYRGIGENPVASMVKLLDRCDNVSSMAGVFTTEKTLSYIQETKTYVMPLLRKTKDQWPEYSNALFVLKYHIASVIDGLEVCLEASEKQNTEV